MLRLALLAPILFGAAPTPAGAPPADERVSRALFEEGRTLIGKGDCGAAIPKLEESLRYHRSVGALLSLAECHEKDDVLAAWRENKEAERFALGKDDDRAAYARAHAA